MLFKPEASNAENRQAIQDHLTALDADLGPLLAGYLDPETLAATTDQDRKLLRARIAAEARALLDGTPSSDGTGA